MAFIYNPNTHNPIGDTHASMVLTLRLSSQHTIEDQLLLRKVKKNNVNEIIPVNTIVIQAKEQSKFNVNFPNDFLRDYKISLSLDREDLRSLTDANIGSSNEETIDKLATDYEKKDGFTFYQNQLNFAVWCATTGCGVGMKQHLQHSDPFIRSLYRFHFYYQVFRI